MSGELEPVLAPTPEVITTRWFLRSTWRDSVAYIAERPAIVPWWVFRSLEVWVGEKRVARGKPWLALSTCWVFALLVSLLQRPGVVSCRTLRLRRNGRERLGCRCLVMERWH